MARLPRFCLPGVPQHIIQRGNNRQVCFAGTEDFAAYAGRLSQVRWHRITVASYRYDYRGLRRQKTTMTGTTQFTYSPNGHLLSEQGAWGYRGRDYVWSDTSPIAQIDARGIGHRRDRIDYLHSDAMGTPRLATNKKQQIVWKWRWDAFGASQIIKGRNAHTHPDQDEPALSWAVLRPRD